MIDTQAGRRAASHELEDEAVDLVEHPRVFHSERREVIHIKEAAVVNFLRGDPPKCQPVRLRVEQLIERVEAARIARFAVDPRQCLFDRLLHLRRFRASALQTSLDDFLFTDALRDALRIGFGALRQIFKRGQNALQFGVKIFVLMFGKIL